MSLKSGRAESGPRQSPKIAGGIREEFELELRAGRAVKRPLDGRAIVRAGCRARHEEILQIIRTGVGISGIIRRHAVRPEIDPKAAVGENGIRFNLIAATDA